MFRQIYNLSKVWLCNLYGVNVFRYSKDKQAKRKAIALMLTWAALIVILITYVSGMTYGLITLGFGNVSIACLITVASFLLFFFGIFKAGNVIFNKKGYDMLSSLPVSESAIVVSRFVRMYVENLLLTLVILVPGIIVYGCMMSPGFSFYGIGVIAALFLPLAPMTVSTFIGAFITGISSRMKHKSLVETALSILLVLAILIPTSNTAFMEGEITPEMIAELSEQASVMLQKVYPPAIWMTNAMTTGKISGLLGCICVFLGLFLLMVWLVSANFHAICRGLYGTVAKHNYQMEVMKKESVLNALYKREAKRYFASSVYVSNTIMGPIMAVIFSGTLLVSGIGVLEQNLPVSINMKNLIPFLIGGIFVLMTVTSSSISMEGKEWWILKSLPLKSKDILDGKLLFNLSVILPFYLVAEVLLMLALKPDMIEMLFLLFIPAVIIVFGCVFGITVNLKFPVLNWDNEVTVVKQSAASMIGGMGGCLVGILCAIPVGLAPDKYAHFLMLIIGVLIFLGTVWLYKRNSAVNLQDI